ncbi:hypothetical protein phi18_141 [Bacillus phage phi18]|nr:hypothetical protein Goe9_c01460 [Bacillus phage vB_BsuM-Goe9]QMV48673.1 hypothetical protein Goe10_c01450 [Bacillus phage vB_BsuM-Goe10]UAV84411.1 hypothetical protein phi18_141 [Bacillus phage phi18]WIT26278.1 hypothetical protein [Bacillus phage SPO1L3]WIT26676.1 hypothetical protein [Bacillus phage SPO1L5]
MKQDTLIKGLVESLKLSTAHTFDIHVGMFKDAWYDVFREDPPQSAINTIERMRKKVLS